MHVQFDAVCCSVTLLPSPLYIATWRMIRECISCGSVLVVLPNDLTLGDPHPVTLSPPGKQTVAYSSLSFFLLLP